LSTLANFQILDETDYITFNISKQAEDTAGFFETLGLNS
jgi:hypothetical protein